MISIIIPAYNSGVKLKRALRSIRNQTYTDIEVIIVDDGSAVPIETEIPISKFQFPIKVFTINHGGAQAARNFGFKQAQGEFVIFWDDDVVGKPGMLQTMLETLERNQKASYAYSQYRWGFKKFGLWYFDEARLRRMPFIHTTSLIRKGDLNPIVESLKGTSDGPWDESIKKLQDWDLWLSMLDKGYVGVFIPRILFKVITGGSMSHWLPKYAYMKPFKYFLPTSLRIRAKKYEDAVEMIKQKHGII